MLSSSSAKPGIAPSGSWIEPLEPRQLLSAAALSLQNLDGLPENGRMIFNRINVLDPRVPNVVHDRGKLRLINTGGQTLSIKSLSISGPWKVVGTPPTSVAPGRLVDLTVQFTATKAPAYTYNQTGYYTNPHGGGAYFGSITIKTNDPVHPSQTEQLAGWWQSQSEHNAEPSLQTIVNLVGNYKTNIATGHQPTLPEPSGKRLYGEEVNSAYWTRADPTRNVSVRLLAAWHGQGKAVNLGWYQKGSFTSHTVFVAAGTESQSFLPHLQGNPSAPAAGSFASGGVTFGFKIDAEWTDDKRNPQTGGGHHIRFYPVRDRNGNRVANQYFMCSDYGSSGGGTQNFDFQDEVYLVTNVKPAGN
jgi:hypothetical protein